MPLTKSQLKKFKEYVSEIEDLTMAFDVAIDREDYDEAQGINLKSINIKTSFLAWVEGLVK